MSAYTIQQLVQTGKQQIEADNPALEAELLLAYVLQKPRVFLHTWPEHVVNEAQVEQYQALLARRSQGEPIAYLTGQREFWSLNLRVTPATLIPRPETELLVETILSLGESLAKPLKIADLGTGSGAIALALASERPDWQIIATDASENALQIASKNAHDLKLLNLSFYCGNWCTALPCTDFDVIVSNPPYISELEWADYAKGLAFEPRSALVSGRDGLEDIRVISQTAQVYLKPGGYLLVEHGFLQGAAVRELFAVSGYNQIHSVCDLSGQERVTLGYR